ncbi:cytochrome P450 [Annulohypoxylon truncatum]|uniref:cytochrome P450 n=1 Tax=Annulohypoxylon truncatum TaxID=327061 RepID=UPI0020089D4A|nr:cytochrome P450 [Annulohypoxylon truncatum]KAI1208442.1 cytochrome P450 [Annulohypoxylon truncatum]
MSYPSISSLAYYFAFIILAYSIWRVLYNVYFHPLACFPGPLIARASLSWTDIYNPLRSRNATCIKSEFYDIYGNGFNTLCIGSERNPSRHSEMKKTLSLGFSTKALEQQEHIIHLCVDKFVEAVGRLGSKQEGVNMTDWYEMIGFDIMGEMVFGESFHSIEQEKPHFWSQLIEKHLFYVTLLDNLSRYPLIRKIGQALLPKFTVSIRDKHVGFSRRQVQNLALRRLKTKDARNDILTNIISQVENGEMSLEQLTAHSSTLVIAGGETVSTFLIGVTYHLLKNPKTLQKVSALIRQEFVEYSTITAASAKQIPYLQAVINEGLRIYPPGSQGFPRISPGAKIDGHWVPKGTEIYTSGWTITHSPEYFTEPNQFIPERWLSNDTKDNRDASQPFLLGPRACLGRNLAYVEMNVILAKLLWRYNMSLVNTELDWDQENHLHVMWWKPELWVRFEDRMES